ncbi:MAG: hypothetical protein R3231_08255 [bacterium]|nr:hypothetical protein [bacterium]
MSRVLPYWLLFASALTLVVVLTPMAGRLALRLGCVDKPGGRKIHARNVPYFGGLAIYLSFMPVLLGAWYLIPHYRSAVNPVIPTFLLGATLVLAVGVIDDFRSSPPLFKFAGQVLAGTVPALLGLRIEFVTNPLGGDLHLGPILGGVLTVVWVVCMINAINLIDGLDGLASGVALISAVALFAVAGNRGDTLGMITTAILAGSCLGFLRYNFSPAQIFLGDGGSMFLGFTLAIIGIQGLQKGATVIALMIPLAALGVPVLDTVMAVIRRSKVRRNIFTADGEHLHHRLVRLGIGEKNAVLLIYFVSVHLGITAFVLTLIPSEPSVMILVLIAMAIMMGIKTLAFLEDKMAVRLRQSEQEAVMEENTGLHTFSYLSRRVLEEMNACDRCETRSFALLLFEIQGLKRYLAQGCGGEDESARFRQVAAFFRDNIRTTDVASYMGDENFIVMAPGEGEGKQYLIDRLTTIFENSKAGLAGDDMQIAIRTVDYPGNRGIVHELLRNAVEVA